MTTRARVSDRVQPDFQTFREQAEGGKMVPVCRRVLADLLTPLSAYLRIRSRGRYSFLLESVEGGEQIARYSFLGCDPFLIVRSEGARTVAEYRDGPTEVIEGPFVDTVRRVFSDYTSELPPGFPPFCGGAVGYLGYDLVHQFEKIPRRARDDLGLDDAFLMFCSTLLAFDHVQQQIWILSNAPLASERHGAEEAYRRAIQEIDALEELLMRPLDLPAIGLTSGSGVLAPVPEVTSNFSEEDFRDAVKKAKSYIRAGDIFQVVLSQRFQVPIHTDPLSVYRALRVVNPSPYMFFLDLDGVVVAGASPEMLIKVRGRELEYRPIAGTRPRGTSDEADRQLSSELLADPKERAEHLMLVDLGRNDLGRVSEFGTVRPRDLFFVEKYSHVIHLVSALEGRLRRECDRFDALVSTFPAGTVSGAPKIRAMEIIDELEPSRRSVYAGAVAYIDFSGNLDSCIAIRTFVMKDSVAYIQAGAGIVADSTPEGEYRESVNKAEALVRAVRLAAEGFRL